MAHQPPPDSGLALTDEVVSFIAAHAVMSLVGLGNPLRLSILMGVEKAVDSGLLPVDERELDRAKDGYLLDNAKVESLVARLSQLLTEPTYLQALSEIQPDILEPAFTKEVGRYLKG